MTVGAHAPLMQATGPFSPRPAALLALGGAMLAVALSAVAFPVATAITAGLLAGWLMWFAGAVMLGLSLLMLPGWLRLSGALTALLVVGAGVFLTFRPATSALALAMLLGAVFVLDGSFQVALALRLRPMKAWRWVLASAFSSLAAAAVMATGAPERSAQSLGILMSLAFATTGLGLVAVAAGKPRAG